MSKTDVTLMSECILEGDIDLLWNEIIHRLSDQITELKDRITEITPNTSSVSKMAGPFPGGGMWEIEKDPKSDDIAISRIFLPASKWGSLHDTFYFECQVGLTLADKPLLEKWGWLTARGKFRKLSKPFTEDTLSESFGAARAWIDAEAKKLQFALDQREKAEGEK